MSSAITSFNDDGGYSLIDSGTFTITTTATEIFRATKACDIVMETLGGKGTAATMIRLKINGNVSSNDFDMHGVGGTTAVAIDKIENVALKKFTAMTNSYFRLSLNEGDYLKAIIENATSANVKYWVYG